jgi:hypothetical protein
LFSDYVTTFESFKKVGVVTKAGEATEGLGSKSGISSQPAKAEPSAM